MRLSCRTRPSLHLTTSVSGLPFKLGDAIRRQVSRRKRPHSSSMHKGGHWDFRFEWTRTSIDRPCLNFTIHAVRHLSTGIAMQLVYHQSSAKSYRSMRHKARSEYGTEYAWICIRDVSWPPSKHNSAQALNVWYARKRIFPLPLRDCSFSNLMKNSTSGDYCHFTYLILSHTCRDSGM